MFYLNNSKIYKMNKYNKMLEYLQMYNIRHDQIYYISYKINIIYTTMMTDVDDIYIESQYNMIDITLS